MRIVIQQTTIILEFDQHAAGPQTAPGPTDGRPRKSNQSASSFMLLDKLKTEVEKGRDANLWKTEDQYGTFLAKQR